MSEIDLLAEKLRPHYSRFLEPLGDRILLTGHSHQAWPNASRDGQLAAWDDAARLIDHKWDRVFGEILPELQKHIAERLGTKRASDLALAPNTHELVYRLASCFPPRATIVSTDSEFHSLRRQLDRFEEDGAKIVRVSVTEEKFADRFLAAIDRETPAWAALSYVLFTTSRVVTELPRILEALARKNVPVLVDAYHAFNVLELDVDRWDFGGDVFICGGGYKYAECGEGACFMLLPDAKRAARYRPLTTGWFSHFESLDSESARQVQYGSGGYRFFGATFDPTSIYRALYVMRFMEREGLTAHVLAAQSRAQTQKIIDAHSAHALADFGLELATPSDTGARAGFVTLATPRAKELERLLFERGVYCDVRGTLLRLGPAPYLFEREIDRAMEVLAACARS